MLSIELNIFLGVMSEHVEVDCPKQVMSEHVEVDCPEQVPHERCPNTWKWIALNRFHTRDVIARR